MSDILSLSLKKGKFLNFSKFFDLKGTFWNILKKKYSIQKKMRKKDTKYCEKLKQALMKNACSLLTLHSKNVGLVFYNF